MTDEQHKQYAAAAFDYAVSLCIRNTTGAEHDALVCAEEDPSPRNLRAAMEVARGKPWQLLFEGVLTEIGIQCAGELLRRSDQ